MRIGRNVGPAGAPGRHVEESGRTVNEAIEGALAALGADRSSVEIDILDEGSRGVLGLGGREARVRVTLRAGRAEVAEAIAKDLLELMGLSGAVTAEERSESIRVEVGGGDVGPLIGKHGQTLGALETLLGLLVGRRLGTAVRVELDAEGYRERREVSLQDLARRTADRVARQGREIALTPMGPRDRRIIHVTLQDHPTVMTVSRGERDMRRVVVMPKGGAATPERPIGDTSSGGGQERPRESENGYETPPDGISGQESGRPVRFPHRSLGGSRSRLLRRRSGSEGQSGRRGTRSGPPSGFGKRPEVPGPRPVKGGRPEGLPVDEELEAEIEAYLAKTQTEDSKGRAGPAESPASEKTTEEGPAGED